MQLSSETKNKRVLLVVGKMGHGKSSFVRSLVLPKYANPFTTSIAIPETSSGFKSVTLKPFLYIADPSHNLTSDNQPVYLIDTEGLDSDTSVSLIVEQIDEIIKQHQLNIIGIAFVVNLNSGRLIGANNSSIVQKFLQILKIRRIHIEDLLFFVVTNWKNCIESEQTEEKIQALKQVIIHSQLNQNILNRTVYWESGPGTTKGFSKFTEQYLSGVGKQQVQRQFGALKFSLTNQIQKKLSYSQYVSDSQKFWTRLEQSLKRCYQEKKHYSFLQQNLDLNFNMKQITDFQAKGLAKKGLKTGVDYTASTLAKGVLNQQGKVKTKIGQIGKKADFVASIAKRFLGFMPQYVTDFIDSASEMTNQIINIVDEEGLQIEENGQALNLWDIPLALASMSLIIYSAHQYCEQKKTKVLSPTEVVNLQQMQRYKLKDKLNLMQRSMIEANLYSKILYKNGQIILKQKIDSVESIKVHLDELGNNLAELTTQKPVKIIQNQQINGVRLSIRAWFFTFESFDQIYKNQIAEFYSA